MVPRKLGLLAGLLGVSILAYMTLGARGNWAFILPYRGTKLLALLTISMAVASSTLVFQTLTANRILTPSIMGFDALYLFVQTALVFGLGGVGYNALNGYGKFGVETGLMLLAALALFGAVLRNAADLGKMVLTGLILGIMLRSLSGLLARLIDPSEFAVVQSASFARFNDVNLDLVGVTAVLTLLCVAWMMWRHHLLDVLALGREQAIRLGVDHDRETRRLLVVVALLVSASTALVGPVIFFGLLATALAYRGMGTWRHAVLLPASILTAATILIASQTLFERFFKLQSSVSVVIEALGGVVFLFLILRRRAV